MTARIRLLSLFLVYCAVLIAMTIFLIIANIIPNGPIWDHVFQSLPSQNYVMSPGDLVRLDQYTECITDTIGLTPKEVTIQPVIRAIGSPTLGSCDIFREVANESASVGYKPHYYWRYWHGYQILSRPILELMDTRALRLIVFLLVCTSLFILLWAVRKSLGVGYVFIFSISLLSAPLYSQFLLASHCGVWVIGMTFASFLLFAIYRRRQYFETYCLEMFFAVGMLTAYADMLTSPLVTLTIPLLILFWCDTWPLTLNTRSSAATALILCIGWLLGYASCWAAKWILAAVFLSSASIADAVDEVLYRVSGNVPGLDEGQATSLKSIHDNFVQCRNGFLILGIAVALRLLVIRRYPLGAILSFDRLATGALIVSLPIIWLALVRNHSIIHAFFVAPILIPSIALLLASLCPETLMGGTIEQTSTIKPAGVPHKSSQ
jgi:hypothetical protein